MSKLLSKIFFHFKKKAKNYLFFILVCLTIISFSFYLKENEIINRISFKGLFFLLWLLAFFIIKWDGRISIGLGLLSLLFCPFLLILEKQTLAEQMAIFAYGFLVCGVIVQIKEIKQNF